MVVVKEVDEEVGEEVGEIFPIESKELCRISMGRVDLDLSEMYLHANERSCFIFYSCEETEADMNSLHCYSFVLQFICTKTWMFSAITNGFMCKSFHLR